MSPAGGMGVAGRLAAVPDSSKPVEREGWRGGHKREEEDEREQLGDREGTEWRNGLHCNVGASAAQQELNPGAAPVLARDSADEWFIG
jgi:hypothetical protein